MNRAVRAPMTVAVEWAAPPVVEARPLGLVAEWWIVDGSDGTEAPAVFRRRRRWLAVDDESVYGCGEHRSRLELLQH